jgi:ABC-type nitrate/sulfonate/bicarbonate transport system permease component
MRSKPPNSPGADIGFMITVAGATLQTDKVFAAVLICAITGMLSTEIVDRAEKKFDKWRPKIGSE